MIGLTFNSLHFVAFLAVVLGSFVLLKRNLLARNVLLVAASWYFYWQVALDVRWLLLLIGTQAFDYAFARVIEHLPPGSPMRRWCVVGSCGVNLLVLGFFKYCNFFIDNFVALNHALGGHVSERTIHIFLPAGISFYTFQSMSYVIDVYRGHMRAERNPIHYALFGAFFPLLVAGPIERAPHLLTQLRNLTRPKWDDVCHGTWLIGLGLFKKVVLADNVAKVAKAVIDADGIAPRPWESAIGIYAFALQIYCDFSAYSDIARGVARLMGFELMRNFDLPYFAVNPSDFWRRWHISLSTWLRDYVYIPLGGNRGGWFATYRNLFLTMLIGGFWHGATWLFVAWGAYHGTLLCLHRAAQPLLKKYLAFTHRGSAGVWTVVRIVVFFQFTCVGWLLFSAKTLENFVRLVKPFYDPKPILRPLVTPELLQTFIVVGATLLAAQLVKYWRDDHNVIFRLPVPVRAAVYAVMILAFIVFGIFDGGEFIYFQF